jgi:hypothetical protein
MKDAIKPADFITQKSSDSGDRKLHHSGSGVPSHFEIIQPAD